MRKIFLKIWLMNKILRHQSQQYHWCKHHDVNPPERMSLWHMIWHKPIDSLQIAVGHYDTKKAEGWFDFCHKCEEQKLQSSDEQPLRSAELQKRNEEQSSQRKTKPQQSSMSQTA